MDMNLRSAVRSSIECASDNPAVRLFQDALKGKRIKRYVKFGTVQARPAEPGQVVVTEIKGKEETRNTAKKDDMLVMNPGGEKYLISEDKFRQRYKFVKWIDSPLGEYKALGECYGFQYEGKPFSFMAPWHEKMICEDGDMIVSTSPHGDSDVYRIEKDAFKATYKLAK